MPIKLYVIIHNFSITVSNCLHVKILQDGVRTECTIRFHYPNHAYVAVEKMNGYNWQGHKFKVISFQLGILWTRKIQ